MAPIIFKPDSCTAARYLEKSENGRSTATYNCDTATVFYEAFLYRPDNDQVDPALHLL